MYYSKSISRNRFSLLAFILVVITIGLLSRKFHFLFPEILGKYPGDVLWALMLYLMIAYVKNDLPARQVALLSLFISCLDEFSQLLQISWLNDIRHTFIGHLILGSVFSWYDILSYVIGIGVGFIFDKITYERKFLKP